MYEKKCGEEMAKSEVLVYLVLGLLESGKTSLITQFVEKAKFSSTEKSLIIACEEGIEGYDADFLSQVGAEIIYLEKEEELTTEFLDRCETKYRPDKVYIEMNGIWNLALFNEVELPKTWFIAKNICLVDAQQFELQFANMKEYMMMHFRSADMIIFNRCSNVLKQNNIKRLIKVANPMADIVFESLDGKIILVKEDELPFDITKDTIEIKLDDYGRWYLDALEHKEHYVGKKVKMEGFICYMSPHKCYAFGRCSMTCCADDIAFMGFVCVGDNLERVKNQCWGEMIGYLEYIKTGKGDEERICVVIESFRPTKMPEDHLVYFTY